MRATKSAHHTRPMAQAIREADARMAVEGFAPCHRGRGDIATDRLTAAMMECPICGDEGHELRAYRRGTRYRAVVICRTCKRIDEF